MMRTMIALLMITSVLLAQDEPKPGKPKADKPKPAAAEPAKAEPAEAKPDTVQARLDEIERLVKELEAQLGDHDDATLRQLIDRIQEHAQELSAKMQKLSSDVLVVGEEAAKGLTFDSPLQLRVFVAPDGGERMSGSFDDNGRKGKYTLESIGHGRYRLKAEITAEGDPSTVIKDEGTLAELQRKYGWLRGGMIFAPRSPSGYIGNLGFKSVELHGDPVPVEPQRLVGVVVRPPADELRHHLELPVGAGLLIESVTPGSRAEKLGLRKYDVLLRIDGELVEEPNQVKKLNGKGVTLEYVRRARNKRLVTE